MRHKLGDTYGTMNFTVFSKILNLINLATDRLEIVKPLGPANTCPEDTPK
jgi:hypothetical protein